MLLDAAPAVVKRMSFLMGTWVSGQVRHADPGIARRGLNTAFDEIKRLEGVLSRFREDSVVSRINREAFRGPVTASREVFDLLERCVEIARQTEGAVDITVAPLVDLWKQGERRRKVPAPEEIERCLLRVGWEKLELDRARSSVRFTAEGMGLDLGAVGKGYILDRAAEAMKRCGVEEAMLDAGGNILVWGAEEYRIGIRDPLDPDRLAGEISLRNEAVATSANDERYFEIDGRRYGHLLDPRTGRPAEGGLWGVSVVAATAMMADAYSTARFVR